MIHFRASKKDITELLEKVRDTNEFLSPVFPIEKIPELITIKPHIEIERLKILELELLLKIEKLPP